MTSPIDSIGENKNYETDKEEFKKNSQNEYDLGNNSERDRK